MNIPCPRTELDNEGPNYCNGGEFTVTIVQDSYGDANVIGGIAYCTDFEVEEQSCKCELTPEEEETLYEVARKRYEQDGPYYNEPDYYDNSIDYTPSMDTYNIRTGEVTGL